MENISSIIFFCFCFVLRHINHKGSFNAGRNVLSKYLGRNVADKLPVFIRIREAESFIRFCYMIIEASIFKLINKKKKDHSVFYSDSV